MNQLVDRSISDRFCHEATIKFSSRFFDEAIRNFLRTYLGNSLLPKYNNE